MRYAIVHSVVMETLIRNVEAKIDEGWEPFGSPFIDTLNAYPRYAQAMVSYDDEYYGYDIDEVEDLF